VPESYYINAKEKAQEGLRQASGEHTLLPLLQVVATYHSRLDVLHLSDLHYHDVPFNIEDWERESPEDVRTDISSDGSLEWVATHLSQLCQDYPDRLILVEKGRVVAYSADIADLLQQALRFGIASPLIIDTQSPAVVSRTAY